MYKKAYILHSLIIAISIFCTFKIKQHVEVFSYQLKEYNGRIEKEKDAIRVLCTEFAYLSSPRYVEVLNDKYLKLREAKLSQFVSLETEGKEVYKGSQSTQKKQVVRWNKKCNNYLITASSKIGGK